jgi:hypothetical protein
MNLHSRHTWAGGVLCTIRLGQSQHLFSIKVSVGMIRHRVTSSRFLTNNSNCTRHVRFFHRDVPQLSEDVLFHKEQWMSLLIPAAQH